MRPVLPALLALAALAVPATAAAQGQIPESQMPRGTKKLLFTVDGVRSSSSKEPRHLTYIDCYHRYWTESDGGEELKFRSVGRGYAIPIPGGGMVLQVTPHDDYPQPGSHYWYGTNTRRWFGRGGSDPGDCGGTSVTNQPTFTCGTKKAFGQIAWSYYDRRLIGQAYYDTSYADCPRITPRQMPLGKLPDLEKAVTPKTLMRKGAKLSFKQTYQQTDPVEFGGTRTLTGSIDWRATVEVVGTVKRGRKRRR